ncbi:uncharacterized protein PGTG_15280 [Puccinia graminis f. sp. tritici CRL 75-36-700-3]|uniref:Uncharacterized protein n=1 Tax=Puccinia graminis f. sp. tritici (strain CRL 75-36-700-3 / race SCCL) TaxID=418459 RepID=E3KYP2_PUCGT|nr:uncharacterized protein PGTG_15280 [Puccinia graminis f. sp. tritici CRL 75-36-700-3]EFP89438.2 hypothetical protein PGTG_15280 [Puccinia graminis f. sp. tritici CRL 75-36-700-3]
MTLFKESLSGIFSLSNDLRSATWFTFELAGNHGKTTCGQGFVKLFRSSLADFNWFSWDDLPSKTNLDLANL